MLFPPPPKLGKRCRRRQSAGLGLYPDCQGRLPQGCGDAQKVQRDRALQGGAGPLLSGKFCPGLHQPRCPVNIKRRQASNKVCVLSASFLKDSSFQNHAHLQCEGRPCAWAGFKGAVTPGSHGPPYTSVTAPLPKGTVPKLRVTSTTRLRFSHQGPWGQWLGPGEPAGVWRWRLPGQAVL